MNKIDWVFWRSLVPTSYVAWAGIIISSLSLVILVQDAYRLELADFVDLIVEKYALYLAVATLPLKLLMERLLGWFDIDVTIHEHWRHVLVLLLMKIGLDIRIDVTRRRWLIVSVEAVWGLATALGAGILAGVGSLNDQPFRVVAAAILGLTCYEFAKSFFESLTYSLK